MEIEEADIVGAVGQHRPVLFCTSHGLSAGRSEGTAPRFVCAVKLPGQVQNFFYYREHLVAMIGAPYVLHFKLASRQSAVHRVAQAQRPEFSTRAASTTKLVVYTRLELYRSATRRRSLRIGGPVRE